MNKSNKKVIRQNKTWILEETSDICKDNSVLNDVTVFSLFSESRHETKII